MNRIIDTGITKEILTGDNCPQIKICDKLYLVDNRQSTFDKIQEVNADTNLSEKERTKKIYDLALGVEKANEIIKMDLPVEYNTYLSFCIMGAITGEDPDEIKKRAQEVARKNL